MKLTEGMYLYNSIDMRMEIMAIRKGYVMFRYKGQYPTVCSIKEFEIRYKNFKQRIKTNNP